MGVDSPELRRPLLKKVPMHQLNTPQDLSTYYAEPIREARTRKEHAEACAGGTLV